MARPLATDYLHNMRFHVTVVALGHGANTPGFLGGGDRHVHSHKPAGFMNCSVPSMQANAVMYKEGTWVYERKFPGEVSMGGDLSLQRGVARGDSSFYAWMRTVAEGAGEYRVDLDIDHFHREQALAVTPPVAKNKLNVDLNSPARTYHVFEAFPTQHDPIAGTLDATSGDVSIMDLQIAYEHFTVEEHA